jgi:hypothetical protein
MYGPKHGRENAYRYFVEAGLSETDKEFSELLESGSRGIGGKDFRKWVDKEYEEMKKAYARGEDISFRRDAELFDTARILKVTASSFGLDIDDLRRTQYNSPARPVAARMLCKYADMNQRQAADELGYGTGAAVSYQLKKLRSEMQDDKKLQKRMKQIEERIKNG